VNINATLLGQAIWFAIFIWITMKYIWPPMKRAMDQRQRQIAEGLSAGERAKVELEAAAKRAAEIVQEARTQAQEILAQAEKRGTQMVDEAKGTAKVEGERTKAAAMSEIDQEVFRAREALRARVSALAIQGAEKILRREVDAKVHADLLTAVAAEL
jgi:F-type H+-transporting ATPase subunit b